ncbi:MAG TPA: hypothetical protein VGU20_23340 [Stellaceae bacterium]|nr:hypothetical protein [Stellaceae bacterium]
MTEADFIIIATTIAVMGVIIVGVIGNDTRSGRYALKRIGARRPIPVWYRVFCDRLAADLGLGADRSGMSASDLDIRRTAHLFIQLRGDEATARAHKMVERMRNRGDSEGVDKWLRIIVAIGELGEPPTEARH